MNKKDNSITAFVFYSTFSNGYKSKRLKYLKENIPNSFIYNFEKSDAEQNVFKVPFVFSIIKLSSKLFSKKNNQFLRIFFEQLFYFLSILIILKHHKRIKTIVAQPRSSLFNSFFVILKIKVINEISEMSPVLWSQYAPGHPYFSSKIAQYFYLNALNKASLSYCFSEASMQSFNELYKDKLCLVEPYPETDDFYFDHNKNKNNPKDILFIGEWSKYKGVELLIEIASEFNIHVHHVGNINSEESLKYHNVTHYGYQINTKKFIKDNIHNSLIGILPGSFEGFSRVYWDYKSLNLQVIGHPLFFKNLEIFDINNLSLIEELLSSNKLPVNESIKIVKKQKNAFLKSIIEIL